MAIFIYFVHYHVPTEFNKTYGTQAYIFTDTAENANMIVVTFRGTAFWAAKDYVTDFDFSFLSMGKMGRLHLGLMKALGLQDEKDYIKGWPKDYTGDADKIGAYWVIREQLQNLIKIHPNAKIIFTGHSMGASLSTIYPALLSLHEETELLSRTDGILNNGRLRPGDETFGNYMTSLLKGKYSMRVTFRYDIVVRIPFDNPAFGFKHFGKCIYYQSWYKGKVSTVSFSSILLFVIYLFIYFGLYPHCNMPFLCVYMIHERERERIGFFWL